VGGESEVDLLTQTPLPRPSFVDNMVQVRRTGQRHRWWDAERRQYLEYDPNHGGELEVYSKRGVHLGVKHAITGELIKPPEKGRSIDVS
jgi:hypothetical protein